MDKLDFRWLIDSRKGHRFVDFIVNDKSLFELFELEYCDRIGTFGWGANNAYDIEQINIYNGTQEPLTTNNRIPIYVCSECGDIGCGATTFELNVNEEQITWSKFGDDNDCDEVDYSEYDQSLVFKFDRIEYLKKLKEIKNAIQQCI